MRETMMHEYNPDKLGIVSEKISLITIFGHILLFLFELNSQFFTRLIFEMKGKITLHPFAVNLVYERPLIQNFKDYNI